MQATDLVVALRRQERLFQRPGVLLHAFLALFESPAGLQARHLSVPNTTRCSGVGETEERPLNKKAPEPTAKGDAGGRPG